MANRTVGLSLLTAAVLCFGGPRTASAQTSRAYTTDFSANYDLVYHEVNTTSNAGFHADVSTELAGKDNLHVVGEVGVNHFFDATVSSYMGGGRLPLNGDGKYQPFVQFLLGVYHCGACDDTSFAIQPGVGVDFMPRERPFRIRVQFDLRHVFVTDVPDFNPLRLSAGVVFPLSR